MRAPPLARIPDVAAPRPDAEPVTITHKPSLDIGFLLLFEPRKSGCRSTIPPAQGETPLRGIGYASPARRADIHACQGGGFSPSCAAKKAQMPSQNGERCVGE